MTIVSDFVAYCAHNILLYITLKVIKKRNEKMYKGSRLFSANVLKITDVTKFLAAGT